MKLYYVATVFCFFFLRRDRIFSLHVANPDEAELLASGRRAMQSLTPYARFSSPTYGPAWAMFLGVLGRIGVSLTLPTAHILSALIGARVCIIATSTFAKFFDKSTALMLISPLMLYWSFGFNHSDYWSLSTELLPMLLLVGGSALAFVKSANTNFVLLGASIVGLGAWSKYQFGLLALAILFALVRRLVSNGFGSLKAMICWSCFKLVGSSLVSCCNQPGCAGNGQLGN